MKKIQLKMKGLEYHKFSPIISLLGFFQMIRVADSAVHGRIWSNFELFRDFMVVLVTCKNEEIRLKMKALEWPQDNMLIFLVLKGR